MHYRPGLGQGGWQSLCCLYRSLPERWLGITRSVNRDGSEGLAYVNNRQLHSTEERLIKENAVRFARQVYGTDKPTPEQVRAALSMLANTAQNLTNNNLGYYGPYFGQAEAFLHQLQLVYAQTSPSLEIPGSGGQKLFYATTEEENMPWINSGTAELAKAGIIVKTPLPTLTNEVSVAGNRDRLTGLPLDEQGRYTQTIAVNGTTLIGITVQISLYDSLTQL